MAIKILSLQYAIDDFDYAINAVGGEDRANMLRSIRERELGKTVDKFTPLRLNSLTPTQYHEIEQYRQQWLDVTATLVKPIRPTWLKV